MLLRLFLPKTITYSYAVGTVTYVKGNKFWALGHTLLGNGTGSIALPVSKVEIAASLKGLSPGFKLTAKLKESVGIVSYDNVFGIEGEIREVPEEIMLPVNLRFNLKDTNQTKRTKFEFRVIKNKLYSASLISEAVKELLENYWGIGDKGTALTTSIINLDDREPIIVSNNMEIKTIRFGPFTITQGPWTTISKTTALVDTLLNSEWEFKINHVSIAINMEKGSKAFYLDSYQILDKKDKIIKEVYPGDEFQLVLGLRSRDGTKQFVTRVSIKIPNNLNLDKPEEENDINIHVESGNNFEERDENKMLGHQPDNQEEFLKALLINERALQKIYIQLVLPPTKLNNPAKLPKISNNQWLQVKNLDPLRSLNAAEGKVIALKLPSPISGYVLDIKKSFYLKLLPKKKEEKAKTKKKSGKKKSVKKPWLF